MTGKKKASPKENTMNQLDTKPQCPSCNKLLDGFTSIQLGHEPKPGDISVCLYCRKVLEFTNNMKLKIASADAVEECGLLDLSKAQLVSKRFLNNHE